MTSMAERGGAAAGAFTDHAECSRERHGATPPAETERAAGSAARFTSADDGRAQYDPITVLAPVPMPTSVTV